MKQRKKRKENGGWETKGKRVRVRRAEGGKEGKRDRGQNLGSLEVLLPGRVVHDLTLSYALMIVRKFG